MTKPNLICFLKNNYILSDMRLFNDILICRNSASLASFARETGPKVVKGDPASSLETQRVAHVPHQRITPTIAVSDSSLKFTHVLYNLSPAGSLLLFLFFHFFICTLSLYVFIK